MPVGGRRSSSTSPARSSSSTRTAFLGSCFAGRGDGSSSTRPSRSATQSAATGHSPQRGFARVHSVAPRSISPCVYASTSRVGSRASASAQVSPRPGAAGKAVDAGVPREHALDVAVEDRGPLAVREHGDGGGGRAADAGQRRDRFGAARKPAVVVGDDRRCRRVEVMRAPVVAQARPVFEHAFERRGGERVRRRETRRRSARSTAAPSSPASAAA